MRAVMRRGRLFFVPLCDGLGGSRTSKTLAEKGKNIPPKIINSMNGGIQLTKLQHLHFVVFHSSWPTSSSELILDHGIFSLFGTIRGIKFGTIVSWL